MANPTTPIGRISYPSVFQPDAMNETDEKKFRITLIFPEGADLSEMKAAAKKAAAEKWGDKIPKGIRLPFRDCAEKDGSAGYSSGGTFSAFSHKVRPKVVGPNPEFEITEESGDLYAGCLGRVAYRAFAYDVAGNKGVAFSLLSVQKTGDGEAFGSHSDPQEDFSAVKSSSSDPMFD